MDILPQTRRNRLLERVIIGMLILLGSLLVGVQIAKASQTKAGIHSDDNRTLESNRETSETKEVPRR